MKKQTGIWIDGSKALVIALNEGQETVHEIESEIENRVHHNHEGDKGSFMGSRHINNEKKFDERRNHQVNNFLTKVMQEVKDSDELYLMGPAEIKTKLRTRIEADHQLSPKLKGFEAADHMTLNQCVEKVKKFYSK